MIVPSSPNALKGRNTLRGVLVANALLIVIGLVRMLTGEAMPYLSGILREIVFQLPFLASMGKLVLSIPVYRGNRTARVLVIIFASYTVINAVPLLIRMGGQFSVSTLIQILSGVMIQFYLLYALLLDKRVKAYFTALANGTDIQEKPLDEMIDEIGTE